MVGPVTVWAVLPPYRERLTILCEITRLHRVGVMDLQKGWISGRGLPSLHCGSCSKMSLLTRWWKWGWRDGYWPASLLRSVFHGIVQLIFTISHTKLYVSAVIRSITTRFPEFEYHKIVHDRRRIFSSCPTVILTCLSTWSRSDAFDVCRYAEKSGHRSQTMCLRTKD